MSKITLSKALRVKNELVSRFNKIGQKIQLNNQHRPVQPNTEAPKSIDCKPLIEEYQNLSKQIIEIKTAISIANHKIISELVKVEEYKSMISKLEDIPVDIPSQNYVVPKTALTVNEPQQFVLVYGTVDINEEDIEAKVKEYKVGLEKAFDAITAHNANTEIELSFDI